MAKRSYKVERINKTKMMNCGLNATIIAYRSSKDMDVKFENGVIVTNCEYKNYERGLISCFDKSKSNRLHETKIMNCGMAATIIAYRNALDIDIQFEDGTIVTNKEYRNFIIGTIQNPNLLYKIKKIGETKMMNCGLSATIIAYRNYKDIDIEFEDGIIVKNRCYQNFMNGKIRHPNFDNYKSKRDRHIGEEKRMNNGLNATIVAIRNCHDIDVEFENGTIVTNRPYQSFQKGKIGCPKQFTS